MGLSGLPPAGFAPRPGATDKLRPSPTNITVKSGECSALAGSLRRGRRCRHFLLAHHPEIPSAAAVTACAPVGAARPCWAGTVTGTISTATLPGTATKDGLAIAGCCCPSGSTPAPVFALPPVNDVAQSVPAASPESPFAARQS